MASRAVGDVVEYRPPVTGGVVIGVVTNVHDHPRFGRAVTFLITDGNRLYRTGATECVFEDELK